MKKWNAKLLVGALVIGAGAVGVALQASANPYYHGYGAGHRMGNGHGWCMDGSDGYDRRDASRWDTYAQQRAKELHDRLKLNAGQEQAWKTYQDSIAANRKAVRDRKPVDFRGMNAIQRMDKMEELRNEANQRMASHRDAFRTFYGTLTPEQQKVFDAETGPSRWSGRGYHRGGGRGGYGPGMGAGAHQ